MALDNFRTIELIWDKANKSIIKTIKTASSDTTGRYLSVKVLDGGQEVTLNNAKLQLYWEHQNFNTSGTDDFNTVNNGGLFKLTFSEEMLTNIGELNAHLVLTLTDGKITSDNFPIKVFKGSDSGVVVPTNGNGLVKQIDAKIDKGNVTLNDLTQEVKLAMTGGSVAVVGKNAILKENIVDGQVTPEKLSDSVGLYEKIIPKYVIGNIRSDNGEFQSVSNRITNEEYLPLNAGDTLVFTGGNTNNRLIISYYDEDKNFKEVSPSYHRQNVDRVFKSESDGYIKTVIYDVRYNSEIPNEVVVGLSGSVYLIANRLKALKLSDNKNIRSLTKTINIPLEAHGIDKATGTIISTKGLTQEDDFTTSKRSMKYLEVVPSTEIISTFEHGNVYLLEYRENFEYLGSKQLNSGEIVSLSHNTNLVKFLVENLAFNLRSLKFTFEVYGVTPKWVYNDYRPNRLEPRINTSFVYETSVNQGRSVLDPTKETKQFSEERHFNTAILELPPNYDPNGDPVKLVVWNHGSAGFLSFDSWAIETSYMEQFDYLLNEGYAILGVFHKTTKYVGAGNVYVMPTAITALVNAYKHVIENYNISQSGVYNAGKSSGGFNGALLSYGMGIPVLATGLLAPTFNPMNTPYGSHEGARMLVAEDFGFEGNHSVLSDDNGKPTPARTPELKQYMIDNAEKMIGYNPWWNGLIGEDVKVMAAEAYDGNSLDYELNKDKQRIFPVPLKIWYAEDDDRASIPEQIPTYVKQIQNTNGNVEVRKMPVGTGGHNSVDSDPNALKIPSITTKLGITHTDVPVAYAELVSYFRRFGG